MAMISGTCSITLNPADGNPLLSGTGLALELAAGRLDAAMSTFAAGMFPIPKVGQTTPPFFKTAPCTAAMVASRVRGANALFASIQAMANADAVALVLYLQANATAHVTNQHLGNLPSSITTGTAINPPSAPVDIPIT